MKAALIAVLCLGVHGIKLIREKEEIKPVQDKSLTGLNLLGAHKTLSQLRHASENTKIKPILDSAQQGLHFVEYEANKEAKVVQNAAKKVQDAVNYQIEHDQKMMKAWAQKEQHAVEQMVHTVQVLSHRQKVEEHMEKLKNYTYKDFVQEHKRTWQENTPEWKAHEDAFNKKYAMIQAHNSGLPNNAWAQGINKFMDYTEDEYNRMLGYKGAKEKPSSSLLQIDEDDDSEVPLEFSWSSKLQGSNSFHRDQGACGSCWAVAAAQVVEDHLALHQGETYQLSMQHLVSCTPNPEQCGGTGGCKGATSELAFKYIQDHGIAAHAHWPYVSGFTGQDGVCDANLVNNKRFVSIGSYVVLPENKQAPLLKALYQQGPVVVSVAASNWQMYSFGVFAGCAQDAIINHAVVAEGFGKQISDLDHKEHKYFLIKNSWGDDWGEDGYMKIKRFDSETEHCGIDRKPQDGIGCKNGPSEVTVCGMCGILYDAAYPLNPQFIGKEHGGTYVKGVTPKASPKTVSSLKGQDLPLR